MVMDVGAPLSLSFSQELLLCKYLLIQHNACSFLYWLLED